MALNVFSNSASNATLPNVREATSSPADSLARFHSAPVPPPLDPQIVIEKSSFVSGQIPIQAGVSMLAQANGLPDRLRRLFWS